jgi:hypothetical protein
MSVKMDRCACFVGQCGFVLALVVVLDFLEPISFDHEDDIDASI